MKPISGDLVAIASKSNDRRTIFGDKFNIINSLRFDNYEEILQSSEVDAIYISTPHTLHREWSIKAAINGKHILCEKPACINYEEGKKVINEVNNAGVFFMEGFIVSMSSSDSRATKSNKIKYNRKNKFN